MNDVNEELRELKSPRFLKYVAIFAVLILILVMCYYLRSIFTPIFLAFAIAYALNPAVDWLEHRIFIIVMLVFVALLLLIPAIQDEIHLLLSSLPQYLKTFQEQGLPRLIQVMGKGSAIQPR